MLSRVFLNYQASTIVKRGYPWVYAGQIQSWEGTPQPGDLVEVFTNSGTCLGFAYVNPSTALCLRMLYSAAAGRRGPDGRPDERLEIFRKLDRAWSWRRSLKLDTDALRLVWAEADGLPGFICDQFKDLLVIQILTAGAEQRRPILLEWLISHIKPRGIYERSTGMGRAREGLDSLCDWAWLPAGQPVPETMVIIQEGPLQFQVDVAGGQKTGFYLDQRATRRFLQSQRFTGAALDCFSYTGGFGFSASLAGASPVLSVDSSAQALEQLKINAKLNSLSDKIQVQRAKVFGFLEAAAAKAERYELVILDPPPFARSAGQRERALAGHRELHHRAAQVLQPGGFLLSCSCSHAVTPKDLLHTALAGVRAAGRTLKVLSQFGPDADHPEKVQMPESRYLSCLYAQVV